MPRGIHAYNYSDLPIFDILFGTFKNPAEYVEETGFYNGASSRIWEMLQAKDVTKEEDAGGTLDVKGARDAGGIKNTEGIKDAGERKRILEKMDV